MPFHARDLIGLSPRRAERLVDVVPKYGDQVRAVMLDVTAPAGAARRGTDRYLRVWSSQVVVSNAGYR
jgi:NADP-dependent 3-hydroxy acid dehydrogenase YdfG